MSRRKKRPFWTPISPGGCPYELASTVNSDAMPNSTEQEFNLFVLVYYSRIRVTI
jgi:hypothetical protein